MRIITSTYRKLYLFILNCFQELANLKEGSSGEVDELKAQLVSTKEVLEADIKNKEEVLLLVNYVCLNKMEGLDNLRASEPCEADVRGTQVSLKNTLVSLNNTQVSLSSSPFSLMVSIYVGGCSCLASLACLARMARTFGSLARWLAHWPHSKMDGHIWRWQGLKMAVQK